MKYDAEDQRDRALDIWSRIGGGRFSTRVTRNRMRTQIHILVASVLKDRAWVEHILFSAASKFGIADTTVTSRMPDTIRCYSERVGFGFAIGGRVIGRGVIVDFNSGKTPSQKFADIEQHIAVQLHDVFGSRIKVPNESDYITVESTLPESEAAREFHRKYLGLETGAA